MTTNYIPGYSCQVVFGSGDTIIGPVAANYTLSGGPGDLSKPVIGAAAAAAIAGQASYTYTLDGHATQENAAQLVTLMKASAYPLDVVLTLPDGATITFAAASGQVDLSVAGDGEMDWSITGAVDGEPDYAAGP